MSNDFGHHATFCSDNSKYLVKVGQDVEIDHITCEYTMLF